MDEMEMELKTMEGKYEGLKEKYGNLSKLYMDLLKQKGGAGHESNELIGGEAAEEPFLQDWRPQGVGLGEEQRDGMVMLSQEFDASELLFGSGMATVGMKGVEGV